MKKEIRIAGAGGHGVISAAVILAKVYGLNENCHVSQTQSYGPEARGGACKAEIIVSDGDEIDFMKVEEADVFVAFNQLGYEQYRHQSKATGIMLLNSSLVTVGSDEDHTVYEIPASEIADTQFKPIVVNIVMLGALTKLLPKLQHQDTKEAIRSNFNENVVQMNLSAFDAGYLYIQEKYFKEGLEKET
jgi:2-oxoglutarate ferredoxin oxidoreductase subunit gamma